MFDRELKNRKKHGKDRSLNEFDNRQSGMQNQGKDPEAGKRGGGKVNRSGQGTIAGSTGTGGQAKAGNPVSEGNH